MGKIVKRTGRCSKVLHRWKFQTDFGNLILKQNISENPSTFRLWTFQAYISKFLLENLIFSFDDEMT